MKGSNSELHNTACDHDVVIIGCGPTGATLANLLALSGVDVLVLDRESEIYHLPRAVHFDDETMRVFQTVGIADQLQSKTRVNPGMRFVDDKGQVLLDWPGIGRHGWHTSYRLHQPDLEALLRGALARFSNCAINLGCEFISIEQLSEAVELTYKDTNTGQAITCTTQFVIGCDGANSSVRATMRTDMQDLGFKERWLVVDVLLKQDMPQLGDHTVQFCSAEQPMTYCRNPGNRRRWEMALPDSLGDEQALDSSRIWSSLARWITPEQAAIERKAIYTFRSQLAKCWRDKRVFIAGDAAHLTPPFMGQGMCAGIRDAANLAWKLAMVVHRECADGLLDSYAKERRGHVREYITTAIQLGRLINSLEQQSVVSVSACDDASTWRMASIAPKLGAANIVTKPFHQSRHVGKLFDQFCLADNTLLDELCGYRAVLIYRNSTGSVEVKPDGGEPLSFSSVDQTVLSDLLNKWEVEAVLVRPDRYILATSSDKNDFAALDWPSLLYSANPLAPND